MTSLADILAPEAVKGRIDPQAARDVDAFLRASRVLLDLLDEEAKQGSRSGRRARKLNPDMTALAEETRAKGKSARASGAGERAAAKAALIEAVRRIAGELPPSPSRKTKSARARHVLGRLNREAARGDAGHLGFKGTDRAFVNFCAREGIAI